MVGSVGLRPGRLSCPRVHCARSVGGATREPLVLRRNCRRRRRARTALIASDVGRRPGRLCCPRVRRAIPSGRRDAGAPESTAQSPSIKVDGDALTRPGVSVASAPQGGAAVGWPLSDIFRARDCDARTRLGVRGASAPPGGAAVGWPRSDIFRARDRDARTRLGVSGASAPPGGAAVERRSRTVRLMRLGNGCADAAAVVAHRAAPVVGSAVLRPGRPASAASRLPVSGTPASAAS